MSKTQYARTGSLVPEATERARLQRTVWVSLAITAIWAAVVVAAAFGGDIVVYRRSARRRWDSSVPTGIPIAILACIATFVVARYGFPADHRHG